ncbi:hypothetical protein NUK34_08070 [Kerstersia gyiorum]|uniref:hypothetical protein n=1 Tax=Kerstersia gyiorum TaxID=206506 RepID=UPI00214FA832|nr:hypothetical protein [Kerstersia gyiorum]MCR4158807.1 hypothetical protein [Kerstersia gyiorum]
MSKMPWFRMYTDFLNDPKMIALAFEDQRHFIGLLALKGDGALDTGCQPELLDRIVAQRLWIDHAVIREVKKRLVAAGLISDDWQPLAWEKRQMRSDSSADRVAKHRAKKKAEAGGSGNESGNGHGNAPSNEPGNADETLQQRSSNGLEEDIDKEKENTHPLPFPAVREILESCSKIAKGETAREFQESFAEALRDAGCELTLEHPVDDRGDGRDGKIDILVTSPAVIGIELDRVSVRAKSVFKLGQVDGYRVAVLRSVARAETPEGLDAVICCGVGSAEAGKGRVRAARMTLKTFFERCRENGEKAISGYAPIQQYVDDTGLPMEFVQLAWDRFKLEFGPHGPKGTRMQADWRRHFLNFVRNGYFRLWYVREEAGGREYRLTSVGEQAKAEIQARNARECQEAA